MKLSFATLGCPGWTLEQIAENAKAMGFDGVELRGAAGEHIGPDETPAERLRIRRLFEKAGVEIVCIMGYSTFTLDDFQKRKDSMAMAVKFIDIARDVGCPRLRVFGGRLDKAGRAEGVRRVVDGLTRVASHAEKAGIVLVMETHDDWCQGEFMRSVIDAVHSPALGVCWDMSNSYFIEPYEKTFPAIKDYIRHVHFKDAARDAEGHVKSRLPGTGEVPMQKALELLKSSGYKGCLSFEWEKKWEPDLSEPEIAFPHYVRHVTTLMRNAGVDRG